MEISFPLAVFRALIPGLPFEFFRDPTRSRRRRGRPARRAPSCINLSQRAARIQGYSAFSIVCQQQPAKLLIRLEVRGFDKVETFLADFWRVHPSSLKLLLSFLLLFFFPFNSLIYRNCVCN